MELTATMFLFMSELGLFREQRCTMLSTEFRKIFTSGGVDHRARIRTPKGQKDVTCRMEELSRGKVLLYWKSPDFPGRAFEALSNKSLVQWAEHNPIHLQDLSFLQEFVEDEHLKQEFGWRV